MAVQPLICASRQDAWIWDDGSTGKYSVRDAYAWLNQLAHNPLEDCKLDRVWKLLVPEKIRMFIWLVLHNAIQVNELRFRCQLAMDATCARCLSAVEERLHCLRDCPQSWALWHRMGATAWTNFRCNNLIAWVSTMARGVHGLQFLAGVWGAWKCRCNWLLDQQRWPLERAWRTTTHDHDDWARCASSTDLLLCHAWTPPPRDTVKSNSDDNYREVERRMGGGGVICDHLGRWVAGCYSSEPEGNAFKAEASALKEVLELVWNRGLMRVICDVDCADLVTTLADAAAVQLHSKFMILSSISQLLAKDWDVRINCVHMDSNIVADYLARRGVAANTSGSWIIDNPDHDVEYLLLNDSLSIP